MCSGIKFFLHFPGLELDQLEGLVSGVGEIKKHADYFEWIVNPLNESHLNEFRVFQSDTPLMNTTENAIYLQQISALRFLRDSVVKNSGLFKLLSLNDSKSVIDAVSNRLQALLARLTQVREVYIFAAHRNAPKSIRYCADIGIKVMALVDNDIQKQGKEYFGYSVVALNDVPKDAIIINSSGRACVQIKEQLERAGYSWNLSLMEFLFLFNLPFQAEEHFQNFSTNLIDQANRIATLYCALEDDQSRSVLNGIINFRLSLVAFFVADIASPFNEEFFPQDILKFEENEIFVDGGAYDGDSYEHFLRLAPSLSKAYLFEPDSSICEKAALRIGDDKRALICNYGLWSKSATLYFSNTGGMDGAISEKGELSIKVVAADEFIEDRISHIKLDVEGAEAQALMGAQLHIKYDRPKMAIALYHRAHDLWHIPELIEKYGGSYRFSLRHYSQTMDDSIVYAYPL